MVACARPLPAGCRTGASDQKGKWIGCVLRTRPVLIIPLLFVALCPLAACKGDAVDFGRIEQASVVRHFASGAPANPDNLRRRQLGAITATGEILNTALLNPARLRREGLKGRPLPSTLGPNGARGRLPRTTGRACVTCRFWSSPPPNRLLLEAPGLAGTSSPTWYAAVKSTCSGPASCAPHGRCPARPSYGSKIWS